MANMAASLNPSLPFPFPTLEAELPDGSWKPVPTDVGAPAGKTKTILVELGSIFPVGARRLRLTTAFEIHWDSASLCERVEPSQPVAVPPDSTHLHWRGFSQFEELPAFLPLTPQYDRTEPVPPWSRTPAGWCTRYGPVDDLVLGRDNEMVLLNGGDELALSFREDRLPPRQPGFIRDFFLYVVGWDKDADFHVGQGWRVEPLPFADMDDQGYGKQSPPRSAPAWTHKWNTRWVGPFVLAKTRKP